MIHKFQKFNENKTSDFLFMGKPITWWFPWYEKYPNGVNDIPKMSEDIHRLFDHVNLEARFTYCWVNGQGGNTVPIYGHAFDIKRMYLDNNWVRYEGVNLFVNRWEEIENFRLSQLYTIDLKETEKWIKYLEFYHEKYQSISDYFLEELESHRIEEICILGTDSDIVRNLFNEDIDVENTLSIYNGRNDFLLALKKWISSGKQLTHRQIAAATKVLKDDKVVRIGKPCLYIKFEDYDKIEKVTSRMSHLNLKINTYNDTMLIWE